MLSGNVFAIFGAAPNVALALISLVGVYASLIYQINAHIRAASDTEMPVRVFGIPEAILAGVLMFFFLLTISSTAPDPALQFHPRNLLANLLLSAFVILVIVSLLQFRGFDLSALGGFFRISFFRTLGMGAILLFFAYPLVGFSEAINQRLFGGGSSKQNIVEFFSGSRTLQERILIIIFAVAIAPIVEEFVFRFFIYGVLKRYVGCFLGVILSSLLFAAAHAHLPSLVPLFVLGSCFAIAYEWSGSILVSMTMHSLFNSLTLIALAFPEIISQ